MQQILDPIMDLFETCCAGISDQLEEYECDRRHEITTEVVPVPVPILYCGVAKLTDLMCLGLNNLHGPVNRIVQLLREGGSLSSFCIDDQDVDENIAASLLTDYTQHTATLIDIDTIPEVEDPKFLVSNYSSFGDGVYSTSTNLMLDKGSKYRDGVPHATTEEKVRDLIQFCKANVDWVDG